MILIFLGIFLLIITLFFVGGVAHFIINGAPKLLDLFYGELLPNLLPNLTGTSFRNIVAFVCMGFVVLFMVIFSNYILCFLIKALKKAARKFIPNFFNFVKELSDILDEFTNRIINFFSETWNE